MNDFESESIVRAFEARNLMAISLLKAVNQCLSPTVASRVVVEGFGQYMVSYYENILEGTLLGSQERFDCFRGHYEVFAKSTPYCQIIQSDKARLRVHYHMCPFDELMKRYDMRSMTEAFCQADIIFTERLLPGVNFSRDKTIAKGCPLCNHEWFFGTGHL